MIFGKKLCCATKLLLQSLLPHIHLVWFEGASSRGKSVAWDCFRSKLPRVYWNLLAVTWRVSSWPFKLAFFFSSYALIGFFHHSAPSSCPSCVLVGALTRERVSGACFQSKLPRVYRPWRVYILVAAQFSSYKNSFWRLQLLQFDTHTSVWKWVCTKRATGHIWYISILSFFCLSDSKRD